VRKEERHNAEALAQAQPPLEELPELQTVTIIAPHAILREASEVHRRCELRLRTITATLALAVVFVSSGLAVALVAPPQSTTRPALAQHVAHEQPLSPTALLGNYLALTQSDLASALENISAAFASAQNNFGNFLSSLPSGTSQLASAAGADLSPLQDIASNIYLTVCPWITNCDQKTIAAKPIDVNSLPRLPLSDLQATSTPRSRSVPATSPNPDLAVSSGPKTTIVQNITQPIKERVIERVVEQASPTPTASRSWFTDQLNFLENKLTAKISVISASNASGPAAYVSSPVFAQSQRIDQLSNTTITNPTISGGSISGASVSATSFSLSGALDAAIATIGDLAGTRVTFVRSTTTNATTSTMYVSDSLTYGSNTGVLVATSGAVSALPNGSSGQVLKMVGGTPSWAADLTSSGGAGAWATTSDSLAVYPTAPSNVVLVGTSATSTTGNILEVLGNSLFRGALTSYGTHTAPSFTATSSTASQFPYACTTAITAATASTSALIISGAPGGLLKTNTAGLVSVATPGTDYLNSTAGDWSGTFGGFSAAQLIAAGFSTTSANYWQTTRNFFASTSADYWLTTKSTDNLAQGSTNKYYATSLFAEDLAGATTTALSEGSNLYFTNARADARVAADIAATTTDALAEGTNNKYFTNARADARINATSSIATLTAAPNLGTVATSLSGFLKATAGILSTALINLAGDVTGILPVANGGTGWANIASGAVLYGNGGGTLATTSTGLNGQVLAVVNGVTAWAATTTFSSGLAYSNGNLTNTGVLSIGPTNQSLTGNITLATSTNVTNGLTSALTIAGSGSTHTFTPSISGTLTAGGGGTGIGNPSAAGLLLGSYAGGSWQQLATSSLGLLTTNVAEGSNLYWTNTRFDARLAATTSLPNITTLANLGTVGALTATSLNVLGTSQFANSSNFFGLTSFGATGTTTIATNGTISTPSIVANAASAFSSSFGSTVTSTFSSSGALLLAGGLTLSGSPNDPLQANAGVVSATTSVGALYGGTGISNPSAAGILLGSYAGGGWQQLATSSLGLLTTNVAEGSNLYYTDARVNAYVAASSAIPKTYTNNIFSGNDIFSGFVHARFAEWSPRRPQWRRGSNHFHLCIVWRHWPNIRHDRRHPLRLSNERMEQTRHRHRRVRAWRLRRCPDMGRNHNALDDHRHPRHRKRRHERNIPDHQRRQLLQRYAHHERHGAHVRWDECGDRHREPGAKAGRCRQHPDQPDHIPRDGIYSPRQAEHDRIPGSVSPARDEQQRDRIRCDAQRQPSREWQRLRVGRYL
jgi:hypothetical protein